MSRTVDKRLICSAGSTVLCGKQTATITSCWFSNIDTVHYHYYQNCYQHHEQRLRSFISQEFLHAERCSTPDLVLCRL